MQRFSSCDGIKKSGANAWSIVYLWLSSGRFLQVIFLDSCRFLYFFVSLFQDGSKYQNRHNVETSGKMPV